MGHAESGAIQQVTGFGKIPGLGREGLQISHG
jgi:hypothetical protein